MAQETVTTTVGNGSPDDSNIVYVGRWDTAGSDVSISAWGGAYLRTAFTGTTATLKLGSGATFYASIDGGPDVLYDKVGGSVDLTPSPLADGTHTLRVAAKTEHERLHFEGLTLDPGAGTVTPTPLNRVVEFVGDSITAGALTTKAALSDYAWLVGERLGAEHTQIAYSGICLVDGVQCGLPNPIGMSRQFFKEQTVNNPNSPDWDFSKYTADAVVINVGTNDANESFGITTDVFQASYTTFLAKLRGVYPNAHIFVLRTFHGQIQAPTQAAVASRVAAGDTRVHYVDTANWLDPATDYQPDDGVHPNDAGHEKVARRLEPVIRAELGW